MSGFHESVMLDDDPQAFEQQIGMLAARGDMDSFGPIYELYGERLKRAMGRGFNGYPPAEDLAHDTFAKAYAAIKENKFAYRGPASLYNWLFTIAVNTGISIRRRSNRMIPVDFQDSYFDRTAPVDIAETVAGHDFVDRMLEGLSPDHAEVVRAVYIEDVAYKDYAAGHDIAIGTVASQLHRARNCMRENLNPDL
ncbi:MAG: RNA polymerase sigma factor [Candidatus Saccharimonadales bacterium]